MRSGKIILNHKNNTPNMLKMIIRSDISIAILAVIFQISSVFHCLEVLTEAIIFREQIALSYKV